VEKSIQKEMERFYNYLWERSHGITQINFMDAMPKAMKSEVFYAVNKFVLDQVNGLPTVFHK